MSSDVFPTVWSVPVDTKDALSFSFDSPDRTERDLIWLHAKNLLDVARDTIREEFKMLNLAKFAISTVICCYFHDSVILQELSTTYKNDYNRNEQIFLKPLIIDLGISECQIRSERTGLAILSSELGHH